MIPYSHQSIDEDDIAAVAAILRGDWLTTGPAVAEFEERLAAACEAQYAVAFANGTAGLHASCAAAGLGPGHVVATSPLTFAASANCALYVGADVAFVDIDPDTLNLDLRRVPACDALIAVHFAGLPIDLSRLRVRPRVVIEDAAHALGALTPDGPVGNCAHSDLCVFSFHPVKSITTGEGGAVTTNSPELAERLRRFRNHGMSPRPDLGGWYYEISDLGFNYRLTDIQAALGTSQLAKLDQFISRRNELAERYRSLLRDFAVVLPPEAPPGFRHAYHLFSIRTACRKEVYDALRSAGIGAQVHYVPVYRHPVFERLGFDPADFPAAEKAYDAILSLPLYPGMSADDQDRAVAVLGQRTEGLRT